jgi:hypothetical protein
MRIVRYLAQEGNVRYAAEEPSGRCFDLTGDIYHAFEVTDHEAQMVNTPRSKGLFCRSGRCSSLSLLTV